MTTNVIAIIIVGGLLVFIFLVYFFIAKPLKQLVLNGFRAEDLKKFWRWYVGLSVFSFLCVKAYVHFATPVGYRCSINFAPETLLCDVELRLMINMIFSLCFSASLYIFNPKRSLLNRVTSIK